MYCLVLFAMMLLTDIYWVFCEQLQSMMAGRAVGVEYGKEIPHSQDLSVSLVNTGEVR